MDIKSIDILDFKFTLNSYIKNHPFPTELKRMLVNEILLELNKQANDEIMEQAEERENQSNNEEVI